MIEEAIKDMGDSTAIDIIVTAGAKKEEISGFDVWRKRLIVRIKEKPLEGKANKAIIGFFSRLLELPAAGIHISSGEKSTQKTLEIEMESNKVIERLRKRLINNKP